MLKHTFNITLLDDELIPLKTNGVINSGRIELTRTQLLELVSKSIKKELIASYGYYLYVKIEDKHYELYTRPFSKYSNDTIPKNETIYQHIDRIYEVQVEQMSLF